MNVVLKAVVWIILFMVGVSAPTFADSASASFSVSVFIPERIGWATPSSSFGIQSSVEVPTDQSTALRMIDGKPARVFTLTAL